MARFAMRRSGAEVVVLDAAKKLAADNLMVTMLTA
jgi:hypothetical protein